MVIWATEASRESVLVAATLIYNPTHMAYTGPETEYKLEWPYTVYRPYNNLEHDRSNLMSWGWGEGGARELKSVSLNLLHDSVVQSI